MTMLQKTFFAAVIAGAVGMGVYLARQNFLLREEVRALQQELAPLAEEIHQLELERDAALKRLATAPPIPAPRLPAPPMPATNQAARAIEGMPSTNLFSRLQKGVQLTAEQVEPYLKAHRRSAASLLAAYRTTGDQTLLSEAMQKYPRDPLVALEAASSENATPEVQRQWLETLKQVDPDNALPNYLLARSYFKTGLADQAVQELTSAFSKPQVQEYFVDRLTDNEEAYLAAGYPPAEAKALGPEQLTLVPDRGDLKQLAFDMVELAKSYQRVGDAASAEAALQLTAQLGRRYETAAPGEPTIDQLLGLKIETLALNAMDPNAPCGDKGETARDRLGHVTQRYSAIQQLVSQSEPFRQTMSDQDWIGYTDRLKSFGEEAALRWVLSKHGQQ
jgi:hypothetical protein